jgi:hypothetical protein
MAYVVDLTIVLHELFLSGYDVSDKEVLLAVDRHDKSSPKSKIHGDIIRFLTLPRSSTSENMIPKKLIDLIAQHCISFSGSSN